MLHKILRLIVLSTLTINVASIYAATEFTSVDNVPGEIQSLLLSTDNDVMNFLVGKEISFVNWKSGSGILTYVEPDTIWLKNRPKKEPVEHKHYALQYEYNGVPTNNVDAYGQPIYLSRISNERFKILRFDIFGDVKYIYLLSQSNREVKLKIQNDISLACADANTNLMNSLAGNIFYMFIDDKFYSKTKVLNATCMFKVSPIANNGNLFCEQIDLTFTNQKRFSLDCTKSLGNINKFVSQTEYDEYVSLLGDRAWTTVSTDSEKDELFVFRYPLRTSLQDEVTQKYFGWDNDTIFIYSMEKEGYSKYYWVVLKQKKYKIDGYHILSYKNESYINYLEKRLSNGQEERYQSALRAEQRIDSLKNAAATKKALAVDSLKKVLKKDKIFIVTNKVGYPEIDYYIEREQQIGLFFKFFNCFDKTIKYIDFKCVAKNSFGDKQVDETGKMNNSGRCVGPINSNDIGVYLFGDLYWNSNKVITDVELLSLTITFVDNTTITYSGKEQLNSHTRTCTAEELGDKNKYRWNW